MRNDLRKSTTTGMARHGPTEWGGQTIHHTAETSRHIAGSDVMLEISTNNLYADVNARPRFAGLPIRNNKLTPPLYLWSRNMDARCAKHTTERGCNIPSSRKIATLTTLIFLSICDFRNFEKIFRMKYPRHEDTFYGEKILKERIRKNNLCVKQSDMEQKRKK